MGTQQILMIVLSVIVVGAAVAVGIQMFDTQAVNSQKSAVLADLNNFGAQTIAYWRTPASMGGGGGAIATAGALGEYLGFPDATNTKITNANGTYTITVAANVATITCLPKETKLKQQIITIDPAAATDAARMAFSTDDRP